MSFIGQPGGHEELLNAEIQRKDLAEEIKVVETGCNGYCAAGPVMVVYPEGIFYQKVTPEDVPELVSEHLLKGRPVETAVLSRTRRKRGNSGHAGHSLFRPSTTHRP